MHWKYFATAVAVVCFASPANAADYRHCWTTVNDSNNKTRYLVVTEIFDAEPYPDFERIWRDWSVPVAEQALRSSGVNGRVSAKCSDYEANALENLKANRPNLFAAFRKMGVRIDIIEPNFGPAKGSSDSAESSSGSDTRNSDSSKGRRESASNDSDGESSSGNAGGGIEKPHYVRVAMTPPPSGYSDWRRMPSSNFNNLVSVYWAQKVDKDEVRVLWRCVNESSVDISCSVGAGKDKAYHCDLPGMRMETTRSLGERATVRSGNFYTFPSDWACRGLGASGVQPNVDVRIEQL